MTTHDRSCEGQAAPGRRRRTWIAALLHRLADSERRRRERQYLLTMDDHMLADIGVRREDLGRAITHRIDRCHLS